MCPHLSASPGDSRPRRTSGEGASAPGRRTRLPPALLARCARSLPRSPSLPSLFSSLPRDTQTHPPPHPLPRPAPCRLSSWDWAGGGRLGAGGGGDTGEGAARKRHLRRGCRPVRPRGGGGGGGGGREWTVQIVAAAQPPVSGGARRDHPASPWCWRSPSPSTGSWGHTLRLQLGLPADLDPGSPSSTCQHRQRPAGPGRDSPAGQMEGWLRGPAGAPLLSGRR